MNGVDTAQALLGSMLVAISFFASVLVLLQPRFRVDQRVFLVGVFLLQALVSAGDLFIQTGAIYVLPQLAGLQLPLVTLLGPAIYFYARAMMSGTPVWLGWKDAWALVAPISVTLVLVPFALLSEADKLALANPESRDPALYAWVLLTCAAAFFIFILVLYAYLYATLRMQLSYRRSLQNHFANLDQRSLDWLRRMLIILAMGWGWFAINKVWMLGGTRPDWVGVVTAVAHLGFSSAFILCAVIQQPVKLPPAMGVPAVPYGNSALTSERMERIAEKLRCAMEEHQLYADSRLSLRRLSDHIGVSENYLSETFSRHLQTNFFDFVNASRVRHAGELLRTTSDSVLDVAYKVGFNSRSTFNSAFKKLEGVTPGSFRVSVKSS